MGLGVRMVVVSILATMGACTEKAPDCSTVVADMIGRLEKSSSPEAMPQEVRSNLVAVLSNRCNEDKWSAQAMACVNAATSSEDLTRCGYKHLSQEQADRLSRATTSTLAGANVAGLDSKPASQAAVAMAKMTHFADRMCQCRDKSCADGVQNSMIKWSTEIAAHGDSAREERPDAAQMQKMTDTGQRYGECMTRAMASEPVVQSAAETSMTRMASFADQMCSCTSKVCADRVQDGMTKWSTDMAARREADRNERPDESSMKRMTEIGQKYAECMTRAMTAARSPSASTSRLPAECGEYEAAIMKLASCDRLPGATRDALRESYEQAARAWADFPAERRVALAKACKAAAEAVNQSAAACE